MSEEEVKRTEQIDRFLAGEMSAEEHDAFTTRLEEDSSLKQEMEVQKRLMHALQSEARDKLREKVTSLHQESSASFPWKRLVAAAVILVCLAVPGYLIFRSSKTSPPELAQTYLTPYPDRITQMSDTQDDLAGAMSAYNSKDYKAAITLFTAAQSDTNGLVDLYLGISYLKSDRSSDAVSTLKAAHAKSIASGDELGPTLQWYLILAYLAADDETNAKQLLSDYLKSNYAYQKDNAEALADELGID